MDQRTDIGINFSTLDMKHLSVDLKSILYNNPAIDEQQFGVLRVGLGLKKSLILQQNTI